MSDLSLDALAALGQMQQEADKAWQALAEKQEEYLQDAITSTDWEATPVIDIIFIHSRPLATHDIEEFTLSLKATVQRYEERAPRQPSYPETDGRMEVRRLTRPLLEHLGIDLDTGEWEDQHE